MKTVLLSFIAALLFSGSGAAAPVQTPHAQAELISEFTALRPGENRLALRLAPEAGWHVYWKNPGDSGIPTQVKWTLPAGVSAGAIEWPYPHAEKLGDLTNYGYSEATLHLIPLTLDADVKDRVELKAEAKWLVCKDVCIPGSAKFELTLPVDAHAAADPRWADAFALARAQLPQPAPWSAAFATDASDFTLRLEGAGLPEGTIEFFPEASDLVAHSAPQRIDHRDGQWRLSQKLSPYFNAAPASVSGVLVVRKGEQVSAWQIQAQPGGLIGAVSGSTPPLQQLPAGLPAILLFALLGGLILNLMPCVFPVLSLKALSVMQSRGSQAHEQRAQALAYTAGVVLSCAAVALLLLGLRAGGAAIGWGFQLQSPVFVGVLAYLMFALGLSLSGVAEFGTRWMGAGQSLTERGGLSGSFFTGVLATVVASPCTAPFMGTALGYAITQPLAISLLVFSTLGLGLALPFLLLGFFPRLASFLPRPGAWMETFKQAMAFPLYLSVVWLLWVLARQSSVNGAAVAMLGLVLIAFALWLWRRTGVIARVLRYGALLGALALLMSPAFEAGAVRPQTAQAPELEQAWSAEKLAQLRSEGRTVFVNFTADWCITCKVNERVALSSDRVHEAFAQKNVAWLTGDWTRADPAITAVLEQFGRSGVPLYLVYKNGAEPKILPQVLTPDLVVESLN